MDQHCQCWIHCVMSRGGDGLTLRYQVSTLGSHVGWIHCVMSRGSDGLTLRYQVSALGSQVNLCGITSLWFRFNAR